MMNHLQLLTVFLTCIYALPLAAEENSQHAGSAESDSSEPYVSKSMAAAEFKDANNYKTLPPLIISIIKAGKVYGYLRLEIQLATKDGHSIEHLQPLYPILMDAYTTKLYSLICDRWIPDTPLPQESVLKIVQDVTDEITKEKIKSSNIKAYLKNFFFSSANK